MAEKSEDAGKTVDERFREDAAAMNQELMIAVVRQHELTETAERLSAELRAESAERYRAESRLFEANQRLNALMNALPVGVSFSDDATCQHVTGNPEVRSQFEVTREDNLSASSPDSGSAGRKVRFFLDGMEITDAELPLQRAVTEDRVILPMEIEILLPSGRRWFSDASGAPVRDDRGNVIGGIAVTVDVTGRKMAQEAIKASEAKYRLLFDNMLDAFAYGRMLYDNDGHPDDFIYLEVNNAFERLTGLKHVVGRTITEVIPGVQESNPELFDILGMVARSGTPRKFDIEMKPLGMWFSVSVYSTMREYFVAIFDNITDRKLAEAELMRAKEEWERTFDTVPDLIAIIDNDHRIVRLNKAMADRMGREPGECVGLCCYETVHCTSAPPECCPHIITIKDGLPHAQEVYEPRLGGHFLVSTTPMYGPDGRQTGSVHVAHDITERKELERQKADLVAMITHDIRSPLTVLSGYAELLVSKSDRLDADTNELVAAIQKSGEKIKSLVQGFSAVSREEAGEFTIEPVPTDIAALLRDACQEVRMAAQENKHDLITEIDGGLTVSVDSGLLQRAVLNLLQNAVNYTPAGGAITLTAGITVHDGKPFLTIAVSDTGSGIPAAELDKVFDRYYRAETSRGVRGTGLGLAIVKAVAEAHGGRVVLDSVSGKGSTFRILIPA